MKLLFERWEKFVKEANSPSNGRFLSSYKNVQDAGINFDTLYKDLEQHFGPNWEKELLPRHGADRKFGSEHFTALKKLAQKTQNKDLLNIVGGGVKTTSVSSSSPFHNPSRAKIKVKPKSTLKTPPKQASSAPVQLNNARVAAVGDSITVGRWGSGGVSYIDILGGSKHAIGGKGSFNLLGMVDQALTTKPEYVIIFVGINNPMAGNSYGACAGNWEQMLKSNISEMYAKVRAKGAKVVGVTLLPAMKTWESHYNKCIKSPNRKGCCKGKRRGARNPQKLFRGALDVNAFIMANADIPIDTSDMFNQEGILPAYDADGIHLNRNGQQRLANKIAAAIG
jgi:lysophospholipase L1-like esterase